MKNSLPSNLFIGLLLVALSFAAAPQALAQVATIPSRLEPYTLHSGLLRSEMPTKAVVFRDRIVSPGAPWLRIHIGSYDLGKGSYLVFRSVEDGGEQRLDARTLPEWGNTTAYFNGDAVIVELHAAPGDTEIYFTVDRLIVGEQAQSTGIESLCAGDNRAPSTDPRVGRLTFVTGGNPTGACTAWLISNGAVLTAGHCVDFDPDMGGPLLPDGNLDIDADDVVEFNVPASDSNGNLNCADPDDQYTIDLNSVVWEFDGSGQGLGKDWAVFDLNPNPNTLLTAHLAQGAFHRMTNGNPEADNGIRITGYGTDSTPDSTRNQIQQSSNGPYAEEDSSSDGIWHEYQVDTTGGNSGSPILWEPPALDVTVGIHTNAGCNSDGSGANSGTSFEHDPLENALNDFRNANTVYVDALRFGATENGTIFHPWNTIAEGMTSVPSGGIVSIVSGSYNETMTISDPMTLVAPAGPVTVGQ